MINYSAAAFAAAYGLGSQLPPPVKPEIVFAGRSNVGKSTLLNKLFNRKSLARVSSTPGKTSTINFYAAGDVFFVDLPGYGYAKVSKSEKDRWGQLIERYFNSGRDIRLVCVLTDMRHPPTKDDIQMLEYLKQCGFNCVAVCTKSDKLNKTQRNQREESLKEELKDFLNIKVIPFSSVTFEGVDILRESINNLFMGREDIV
ncbi:MAG: ribosome biogenesis GTP-binding protein YihA/YsxC [Oscillospiraceae bacterium]|jgi:GTP-binding protein|nr:ribosome biogenesis GTP-binding protein YihA/YsxC [Oscillospiraceae bacterium]